MPKDPDELARDLAALKAEAIEEETIIDRLTRLARIQGAMYLAIKKDRKLGVYVLGGFCLVILAMGLVIWAVLNVANTADDGATKAQAAIDRMEEERADARVQRCDADNDFANKHNRLTNASIKTFQDILDSPSASDSTRAFAANRKADFLKSIVPLRDCSPKGIERYYAEAAMPSTTSTTSTTQPR